jgi:phospholipid/cholesterol/gamma-HCH transport system substrate-binding protein
MDKSKRLEIKVGMFVLAGLILVAILLLQFSKSTSIFRGTYLVRLHATNVGGIKPRAQVLLAGVQVGDVSRITLADDGRSVTINLDIYKEYEIFHDARFVIQTAGILGDQYVAIVPTDNTLPLLTNNADVSCEAPFDLQEVARTATGFIKRIDETARKLDESVTDFRRVVLNGPTLTNFAVAINNVRAVSEEALETVHGVNQLVTTNKAEVALAVSNLVYFSRQLNGLADSADSLLATNGAEIGVAVKNVTASTETLKGVLNDVQAGKGLAGAVLQNHLLASNVEAIVSNLAVTSSNLNRHGLWGIMWSHKPAEPASANSAGTDGGHSTTQ